MKRYAIKNFILLAFAALLLSAICALAGCNSGGNGGGNGNGNGGQVYILDDESGLEINLSYPDGTVYNGGQIFADVFIYSNGNLIASVEHGANNEDLYLEFADNVNAGTASVTVRAKSSSVSFRGSRRLEYKINRAKCSVPDIDSAVASFGGGNYSSVTVEGESAEIASGKSVEVPSDCTLIFKGKLTVNGSLVLAESSRAYIEGDCLNCGQITVSPSATLNLGTVNMSDRLENRGNIVNRGTINFVNDHDSVLNKGVLDNSSGTLKSPSPWPTEILTDTDVVHAGNDGNGVRIYRRRNLEGEAKVSIAYTQCDYDTSEHKPEVTVTVNGERVKMKEEYSLVNYAVEYSDNVNVGVGKVTVRANNEGSRLVFGETVLHFDINAVPYTAESRTELDKALEDENYATVIIGFGNVYGDIAVGRGKTLVINPATRVTFVGEVVCEGKTQISEGAQLTVKNYTGAIENFGTLDLAGECTLSEGSANHGRIYCSYGGGLKADSSLVNDGEIYLNAPAAGISDGGTVKVRRKFDENNVSLFKSSTVYNGAEQPPTFTFAYDDVTESDYTVEYLYGSYSRPPVNAGVVTVNFGAALESAEFWGRLTLEYTILRAPEISVSSVEGLAAAFCGNYERVVLRDGEYAGTYKGLTVPQGENLVISQGCTYVSAAAITVNGTLTVDGEVYASVLDGDGALVLDGGAYLNYGSPVLYNKTGEGSFVIRTDAKTATYTGYATSLECVPGGAEQTDFAFNGGIERGTDYLISYSNNLHAGSTAGFTVTAKLNSKKLYGSFTLPYSVVRGENVTVTNSAELADALTVYPGCKTNDYLNVTLGADISSTPSSTASITFKVPEDVTLNLADYRLTLGENSSGVYTRYSFIVNDGVIITKYNLNESVPPPNYSGSGKIVGIMTADNCNSLSFRQNHEIWLSEDVGPEPSHILEAEKFNAYFYSTYSKGPLLNLCGHTYSGRIQFNPAHTDFYVKSSGSAGSVSEFYIQNTMADNFNEYKIHLSGTSVNKVTCYQTSSAEYIVYEQS